MSKILVDSGINPQGVPWKKWLIKKGIDEDDDIPKEDKDSEDVEKGKKRKDVGED